MWAYVNIYQTTAEKRIKIFNMLEKRKVEIESNFGNSLEWAREAEKSVSRIVISCDGDIELSDDELEEIREWHIENLLKLKEVFQPEIERALVALNSNEGEES